MNSKVPLQEIRKAARMKDELVYAAGLLCQEPGRLSSIKLYAAVVCACILILLPAHGGAVVLAKAFL